MNILEMSVAASVLIVATVIIRAVGLYRLPKKMFLCLWLIATLRLLVPVSIPLPFAIPADWGAPVIGLAANPGAYIPLDTIAIPDASETAIPVALIVWLAGTFVCALYFSISYFKCRKEFKTSLPVESEFIDRWLREHPLRWTVQVRQTDRTKAPLTYGVLRPVILLPKRIDLTDETSLRCVLAHEYVHIRHLDALTKMALAATVCCHWFNPLVWVMYILANRDIELICDETVVRSCEPEGRSAYALTLIKLEEVKSCVTFANYFSKNFVEERMTAIMKTKKYTLPAMLIAFALVICATAAFAVAGSDSADQPELASTIYDDTVVDADPNDVVGEDIPIYGNDAVREVDITDTVSERVSTGIGSAALSASGELGTDEGVLAGPETDIKEVFCEAAPNDVTVGDVIIDEGDDGVFRASVSIRLAGDEELTEEQLDAIRDNVSDLVEGLEKENVVVTISDAVGS